MSQSVITRLQQLVSGNMHGRIGGLSVDGDTLLFEGGLELDSFALLEFISMTEAHFGTVFGKEDFTEENFMSLKSVAETLVRRGVV